MLGTLKVNIFFLSCIVCFRWKKITVLKFVGLAIGFLAKFVTGSIFVFNVYQDAIKQTFNYTQKEGNVHV